MDYHFAHRVPALFDAMNQMERTAFPLSRLGRASAVEGGSQSGVLAMNPRYHHVAADNADILSVELPGVEKNNVKLDVKDFTLSVSGERMIPSMQTGKPVKDIKETGKPVKDSKTDKAEGEPGGRVEVTHVEGNGTTAEKVHPASAMKYSAMFSLAKVADVSAITADYKNGLLTIIVPHKQPETRRIELH
jgi:HSP20 family molecular chaperone IbpA